MAASSDKSKPKKGKKGGRPKGDLTMRLESVKVDARDNVPRTDDSAGPLIFFLLLVFFAVGAVAWHYFGRLIGPAAPTPSSAPAPIGGQPAGDVPIAVSLSRPAQMPVAAYAYDASERYLIPFSIEPGTADPLEVLREALNAPAPGPGIERILPGNTQLRDLRRENDLALCDLPAEALALVPSESAQLSMLEALTRAIRSIPQIRKVQFLVDGKVEAMTEAGIEIGEPWSEINPINSLDSGVADGRTATFFFLDSSQSWLIPVVMTYDAGGDPLTSLMQRLMEGPPPGLDLRPSIPSSLTLDQLQYDEVTATLGLAFSTSDPPQEWGLYRPALMTQSLIATLSLKTPIKALWMTINGQDVWTVESFAPHRDAALQVDAYNRLDRATPPGTDPAE